MLNPMLANKDTTMHFVKEVLIAVVPSGTLSHLALISVDTWTKILYTTLGCIWLCYRIAIARKELKSKQ
jgi:hypothetical protein